MSNPGSHFMNKNQSLGSALAGASRRRRYLLPLVLFAIALLAGTWLFTVGTASAKVFVTASEEFSLHSDNSFPQGIWSDGTTVWIADASPSRKIFAYKRADGGRDSSKDFDTLQGAGNLQIKGIWSDGTTMWVADWVDDKLYTSKMSDKSHDSGKDISLDSDNGNAGGIWSDGTTMWVLDTADDKIYAYTLSGGTRDSSKDFDTLTAAGNIYPGGIWSDGTTMWVADGGHDRLFAYKMSDQTRDPINDLVLSIGDNNFTYPGPIWSDGEVFLLVNNTFDSDKVDSFSFTLPEEATLVSNTGQTRASGTASLGSSNLLIGARFTTGTDAKYQPTSFGLYVGDAPGTGLTATLNQSATVSGATVPGTAICTLTNPTSYSANSVNEFAAPTACGTLAADATYFVVLERPSSATWDASLGVTTSDDQDAGAATGWSVGDDGYSKASGSSPWTTSSNTLLLEVKGLLAVPNSSPIGTPIVTGLYQVGEMLTAHTDHIDDSNGLENLRFQWARIDCANPANDGDLSGETDYVYTVTAADLNCSLELTVYFRDADDFDESIITTITPRGRIIGINVISVAGTDNAYGEGDDIIVTVAYNEPMRVTGTPQLKLGIGSTPSLPDYSPVHSTSNVLAFLYKVKLNQSDRRGIEVDPGSLVLNGGTIKTQANPVIDGSLDNPLLPEQSEHKVDAVPPILDHESATVAEDGRSVELDFSEDMDGSVSWSGISGRLVMWRYDLTRNLTITGTVQAGEVLTADTSEVEDADGLGTFFYQWSRIGCSPPNHPRNNGEISVETNATYMVTSDDVGCEFMVTVSYTDGNNNHEVLIAATDASLLGPQIVTIGSATVSGDIVTLSDLSPRIQRDWVMALYYEDSDGNDSNVFQDLAGNDLRSVTRFVINYSTYVPNYAPTGVLEIFYCASADSNCLSHGTVQTGVVLRAATDDIADANGLGTFSYQWSRTGCSDPNDDGDIAGETSVTYTVVADDLDCVLKVTVTYTDGDDFDEELSALTIDLSLANWSLSRNRSSVTEGGTVTVTLRITNGHTYSSAVTAAVYYGDTPVADGGLLAAQDGTHTITVPAGQNQGSVTLTARDDDLYNVDRSTTVQLTARVGQTTLGSAVSLTVRDNEARPSITLSASSDRVIEGESITLTATAQPRYAGTLSVDLLHTDNTGILSGTIPTTLEFAAEAATAEAVVATVNDNTEMLAARATFTIRNASTPGRLGSPTSVTLTWVDDDGPPLIGTPRDGLQRIFYLDEATYGYRPAHGLRFYWWSVTDAVEYKLEYRKTGVAGTWSRATVGDFDQSPSITDNRILMGMAAGLECGTSYDVRLSLRGARPDYVDGFGPYVTRNGQWTGPCPKTEEITDVVRTAEPDCFTITWTRPTNTAWTGFRVARHVLPPGDAEAVREVLHERVNDSATRFRDCSNQHGNKYGLEDHSYIYDVQYLRRGTGLTLLEEGPRVFTPTIDSGAAGRPPSPRNLRLTTDTRTRRTMTWEAPPNHYLTANRALRGDLTRGNVTDPWINGYIVERREYTGNPANPYSIEYPAGSNWKTMREGYDGTTTTSYTDREDRGTTLYVYRVRTTNPNGASSEYSNDYLWDAPVVFVDPGETEQAETPAGDGESGDNSPATGAPAISGTARVDETLTASMSGIADQDGLDDVSYSYQWIRSDGGADSDISGANSSTYEPTDADQGKTIKVKVTFRDDADNEESLTSAATGAVAAASSEPLTASFQGQPSSHDGQDSFTFELRFSEEVELSYLAVKDHALTVTGGDVTGAQRLTQGSNIGWRITVEPDSDADVTIVLPATSDCSVQGAVCTGGGKKLSAGVELTVPGPAQQQQQQNSEATGAPTISGTLRVGETLTASTSGIADADGLDNASFSYQWIRDDADIAGETARTFDLTDDDVGRTIKVRVTFTDNADNEETLTSAATGVVAPRPAMTASIQGQPSSHDGQADFTFELHFSEELPVSYLTLRDHAFTVTSGTVIGAQRLTQGSNVGWRITVTPGSDADVAVVLPVTTDCDASGAICTGDGRMLSNRNEFTVSGP